MRAGLGMSGRKVTLQSPPIRTIPPSCRASSRVPALHVPWMWEAGRDEALARMRQAHPCPPVAVAQSHLRSAVNPGTRDPQAPQTATAAAGESRVPASKRLDARRIKLSVLRAGQEALPLVTGKDVRCLAAVLRVADRDAPVRQVCHLDTSVGAARAALEPAEASQISFHRLPLPLYRCYVSSVASLLAMSAESLGDSAAARSLSNASAQSRTSLSFSR